MAGLIEILFPGGSGYPSIAFFAYIAPYIFEAAAGVFKKQCVSSVEIQSHDEIFTYIMSWVARNNKLSRDNHRLSASSSTGQDAFLPRGFNRGGNEEGEEVEDSEEDVDPSASLDVLRNKISLYNARPLHWTPSVGTHWFWYENRIITFKRSLASEPPSPFAIRSQTIVLSCLGRNPEILKRIIYNARIEYLEKQRGRTSIFRAVQSHGDVHNWARSMSKPTRPMSTIALEEDLKQSLIKDLARYLNPRTKKWYATRGIPYRRGYLFSGPPGTGKTSLTLAAAGLMGLDIYMISLSSPNMSEDSLANLFQNLPRSCLVLLEDIDAAGVAAKREKEKTEDEPTQRHGRNGISSFPMMQREPITLSGLLNVLDGVSAQEGRVLVMTSNHTENIDPALLRPGRVDFTIEFGLASFETITQLFKLMYRTPSDGLDAETGSEKSKSIDELADEFARIVPAHTFTPAAIQGYLLLRQDDPVDAVESVRAWLENEQKRLKKIEKKKEMMVEEGTKEGEKSNEVVEAG
ncbi:hypothetical protein ACLX1H_005070 [Fusarium chlamydosporum]